MGHILRLRLRPRPRPRTLGKPLDQRDLSIVEVLPADFPLHLPRGIQPEKQLRRVRNSSGRVSAVASILRFFSVSLSWPSPPGRFTTTLVSPNRNWSPVRTRASSDSSSRIQFRVVDLGFRGLEQTSDLRHRIDERRDGDFSSRRQGRFRSQKIGRPRSSPQDPSRAPRPSGLHLGGSVRWKRRSGPYLEYSRNLV